MLQPGDQAPDFTLPDQNGDVSLSSLRSQTAVLYYVVLETLAELASA